MKLANRRNLFSSLALSAVMGLSTLVGQSVQAADPVSGYTVSKLISNSGDAPRQSQNLVNPIGLDARGRLFVAQNGTSRIASYGEGEAQIIIPSVLGAANNSRPTAMIENPTIGSSSVRFYITNRVFTTNSSNPTNIIVTQRIFRAPATMITVTEEGTIAAWNPEVARKALIVVNNSGSGAVYKGAALARNTNGNFLLYVANFHSSQIEVYNGNFQFLRAIDNPSFVPPGYAPFNVKRILGNLFVTYVQQGNDSVIDQPGLGNAYIAVFNENGVPVRNFAQQGNLNSPWGMAYAPRHFGKFSHVLLVGNNGDGHINAFDIITGEDLGQLADNGGNVITIDGLWALEFNRELERGNFDYEATRLLFTAGPNAKANGLIGSIKSNAPLSNR
jgi:uncharacterized protein (TIGR03118 family)